MLRTRLANGKEVSVVGIGGHHQQLETGRFEETYGPVREEEVAQRAKLVERAVKNGVTYFDSTWYSEAAMLARTVQETGVRDQIHINGMVLGAFTGSKGFGMADRDYFSRYLDKRLAVMPGHRFDSFMINAIDERYDEERCAGLLELLAERKGAGDIGMIGFSCHNHTLARQIADRFPAFELIMTAYNFVNRSFEKAFEGYEGSASFVAMKPMIWAQYGIPFCSVNFLPDFETKFGMEKDDAIGVKAVRFARAHPLINVALTAVNSEAELDSLLAAGDGENSPEDLAVLGSYRDAVFSDDHVALFLGGLRMDSLRTNLFSLFNLCDLLGIPKDGLSDPERGQSPETVAEYRRMVLEKLKESRYRKYL